MDCKDCKGYGLCDMVNETPNNCPIFEIREPEKIFMFSRHIVVYKTPMIKNSEGKWELDESYEEITNEITIKEWFEDENGVELEMEEE